MALEPDILDEIGGDRRPILEVPRPLSDRIAFIALAGLSVLTAPLVLLAGLYIIGGDFVPLLRPVPVLLLGATLLATLAHARNWVALATHPVFEVGKDGLCLRSGRGARGLHLDWGEVSHCHWSHFEPGVLNIQSSGHPGQSNVSVPTRHFYRVPEPHRAGVEKAIRAMGKWAERESDSAPVTTSPPVVEPAPVKVDATDEFAGPSVPLVAIERPWWKAILGVFWFLMFFSYAGFFIWSIIHSPGNAANRQGTDWLFWLDAVLIGVAVVAVPQTILSWVRLPEFSVGKEGIRLPFVSHDGRSPSRGLRRAGLLFWDEVSYCRWSLYDPGILQIQVSSLPNRWGHRQPATRLSYRVPEPYRQDVERAIRSCGKWADPA
jgi:hypothetical protein